MPLDVKAAPLVTPPEIRGLEVVSGAASRSTSPDIGKSKPVTPPALLVSSAPTVMPRFVDVVHLHARMHTGYQLARIVLFTTAGSIVLLLGTLVWMDSKIGKDVTSVYGQVLNPSRIGTEFYTLGRLEKLSVDLRAAQTNPTLQWSADSSKNTEDVLKMLSLLPSVTSTQKAELHDCVSLVEKPATLPLQMAQSRATRVSGCLDILENIRQAALEAAAGSTNSQVAGESANRINEQRQSFHTFWIQGAQLILLNLLLPLLTALFGYIFGTQQTENKTPVQSST